MLSKTSDRFWNIFFSIWKMLLYAVGAIIMFRILQTNWLIFMLICIIIIMVNPGYFKS